VSASTDGPRAVHARETGVLAALVLATLVAVPGLARAEPVRLHVAWDQEVPLTVAGLALWFGVAAVQDEMGLHHCGWCGPPGPVDRAVRRALLAPDPDAASTASSVVGFVALPLVWAVTDILSVHVQDRGWMELVEDLLVVAEAFVLTSLVTRLVKISTRRPRPYAEYGTADACGGDALLSFFSGHTSMSASVAASAATLAFLRGSRLAPWVAGLGAAMVVATGLLRIAADRHWASDVLAGLLVGTALGVAVPMLHVRRSKVAILPGPSTVTVVF